MRSQQDYIWQRQGKNIINLLLLILHALKSTFLEVAPIRRYLNALMTSIEHLFYFVYIFFNRMELIVILKYSRIIATVLSPMGAVHALQTLFQILLTSESSTVIYKKNIVFRNNFLKVILFLAINIVGGFWGVFFASAFGEMVLAGTFATWYWTFKKTNVPFFTLTESFYRAIRYFKKNKFYQKRF